MKTELKYGAIFAVVVMVYVMIEHVLGFNTTRHDVGQYTRLAGLIVPVAAIFFGIRAKRAELNGELPLLQGVKTGFIVAVVQTTLTTLFFLLYGGVINPIFLATLLDFERSKMIAAGTAEAVITSLLSRTRSMYSLPVQPVFQMAIGVIYGTIFAIIFAAALKKKPSSNN